MGAALAPELELHPPARHQGLCTESRRLPEPREATRAAYAALGGSH